MIEIACFSVARVAPSARQNCRSADQILGRCGFGFGDRDLVVRVTRWRYDANGERAISAHSKRSYPPHAVILIAFRDGEGYHRSYLERILRQGGHYGIVIHVLGARKKK